MDPSQPKKSSGVKERFFLSAIIVYIVIALAFIANWYGWIRVNSHLELPTN